MTDRPRPDRWRESIDRTAAEARQLASLATGVLVAAVSLYVVNVLWPLAHAGGIREAGLRLVGALPAAVLIAALWDVRAYLDKVASGELWGPATTLLLGRVGEALVTVAATATLLVPNLLRWIGGTPGGLTLRVEPELLGLAGLGLLLSLVARVMGNVVEVAAALEAENDEIV